MSSTRCEAAALAGWAGLRHGGLLLDPQRVRDLAAHAPEPLAPWVERELRRRVGGLLEDSSDVGDFVAFVLEQVCGFGAAQGRWLRGSAVGAEWSRRAVTGETVKPRHLWTSRGGMLPVFLCGEKRLGVGRGRKVASMVVQWLRGGDERLALLTNGRQWRLIFAGLDIDAWCEWDVELWLEEGVLGAQVDALRTLLQPSLWVSPEGGGARPRLERAVLDSRKGQAELSAALGERVREAVEALVQAHGDMLVERVGDVAPADVYRAAVRVIMRLVVVLFAESRDLLPRDNAVYHESYGLNGLLEQLEKVAARGSVRLAHAYAAWPRVLSLFRLVREGCAHAALPLPAYGGELFAPGDPEAPDGLSRALHLFETGCFARQIVSDRDVLRVLQLISRTRVRLRQGRATMTVSAPVDFSDLSTEYIGILYEGLLDYELKTAPRGDPVIFLAVGNTPALPLSRLEAMDDKAISGLLDKLREPRSFDESGEQEREEAVEDESLEAEDTADTGEADGVEEVAGGEGGVAAGEDAGEADAGYAETDARHGTRTRAETWARRAVAAAKLVRPPGGRLTPEKRLVHEDKVARAARALVSRVVLPGEWYLVRWGGTRKGAGTFYTRPGLAVPTVQRTLRPLAFDPPTHADGSPNLDAPPLAWKPKRPEQILALKVCDPACGSGTFPVAALRYLTDALYESLHHHDRIGEDGERALVRLLEPEPDAVPEERLAQELLPCRPDDETFEPRLKALLRRHVVERCIYGVDLDPLAVELCRLSLWIETMDRELPFSFLDHKVKCGNSLVGAWFDTFRHYPVMAFKNREGGDKGHANGVHFAKDARGKALKAFVKDVLTPDLRTYITREVIGQLQTHETGAEVAPAAVHDRALATLARLHDLPVEDAAERARVYREELVGSPDWRQLKAAMDLWCACWFWPADRLDEAPLPTSLAAPPAPTAALAARIAAEKRFFHWELEFPDVFRSVGAGFDAVLGNPPWENLQPNPEEFFSNFDPLFRTYGRLAKNQRLQEMFTDDAELEHAWLEYSADFNSFSNWVTCVANPFGDRHGDPNADGFAIARGKENDRAHDSWRRARSADLCYSDAAHPFRHQTGRIFTYRLFLEQCHALLRQGGRMGQIIPSGIYSDAWSQPLRELFLDHCRWEWLFGFENRDKVFDIHRSFKFNPVVVEKGGRTDAVRTAFMRRALEDWERAEELAVPYTREQVERFSPRSRAILEIQSARDLEILGKIYANSVLLGDDGPDGWGVKYKLEFMMNTDAHLFPPRPAWEAKGYRPDEYSRWLLGRWRPIEELWAELGVDVGPAFSAGAIVNPDGPGSLRSIVNPECIVPVEVELEDWLFDTSAGPERRVAEARFVHGHLLKPGDVARTDWRLRCAQPPYDSLPIPRADIPAGIILSREADAWIREGDVEDVALPLYEGRMIGLAEWTSSRADDGAFVVEPAYLMASSDWSAVPNVDGLRVVFRDIARTTDTRTFISATIPLLPCGNPLPVLLLQSRSVDQKLCMASWLWSFVFDWSVRQRMSGTHLNWHVVESLALPSPAKCSRFVADAAAGLSLVGALQSVASCLRRHSGGLAVTAAERLRRRIMLDGIATAMFGLDGDDLRRVLDECDLSMGEISGQARGFWRVDKDKDPELRHTVLTLVAFHDLEEKIRACGGDPDAGIEAFLGQNDGEGWMLPETLRLADYGLGHDERAQQLQPVASRLGPRFYDWQLTQSAEESWRECHLHARNLLGEQGYRELLDEIAARRREDKGVVASAPSQGKSGHKQEPLW